jgi:hypothetical protein
MFRCLVGVFIAKRAVAALVGVSLACGVTPRPSHSSATLRSAAIFDETFEHPATIPRDWVAILPEMAGATVLFENGAARLVLPSGGDIELRHALDPVAIRGKRVRVSARVRTKSGDIDPRIVFTAGTTADARASQVLLPPRPADGWNASAGIFDVAPDAVRADVSLVLKGKGDAWFDDVKIEVVDQRREPPGAALSAQQIENAVALARASALIRYRHPSDQAAALSWDTFLPVAMERILRADSRQALVQGLRAIFHDIAPTVEFSEHPTEAIRPARGRGDHLARWRHIGVGSDSNSSYKGWREGRDDDLGDVAVETTIEGRRLVNCAKAQLRALMHDVARDGEVRLYAEIDQGGVSSTRVDRKMAPGDASVTLDVGVPVDAYAMRLGVQLTGRSSVALEALSVSCDGRELAIVDVEREKWLHVGNASMYAYNSQTCGNRNGRKCLTIARLPLDTSFVADRDILDVEIINHLWVHVPLGVWSDSFRTFPEIASAVSSESKAVAVPAVSLATIASAWGVLWLFYPYFRDQQTDWERELRPAIADAGAAASLIDTHKALTRLLAKLHDNHARAMHPALPINGTLPIALRRFGDKVVIVGVLDGYGTLLPVGAEITAFDGVPALQAYDEMRTRVSGATDRWIDYMIPFWLTVGPLGTFSTIRVHAMAGREVDLSIPRLSRAVYDADVRERRPASGAELAPGVSYVDLDGLKIDRWQSTFPKLTKARAIVLDMRGYPTTAVLTVLGQFLTHEIRSPVLQKPLLETGDYQTSSWTLRPVAPRLDAKLVVILDGRAGSAAETFLQMVHDNHLALMLGEPSAGTNGVLKVVALPGGFSIRFSGMRVLLVDGTALQGHGITPDILVHPTLEGVRAGRDELLEAAVSQATKLIAKPGAN